MKDSDFVLITRGKIDKRKNIDILLQTVNEIQNENIKIIVFGSITNEMSGIIKSLIQENNKIKYVGWVDFVLTYQYFFAADLAVFPGTHSTLWEEAVGYGIPSLFKRWEGINQIDRGGNCILLDDISVESLKRTIIDLYINLNKFENMRTRAMSKEVKEFFYYNKIARKAIEL